ncbi:adenylate/guanylate cyclase domain-containing protein [Nocardioides flavescens]|uniref:Adenylate/guanylate cyclase domain-containing protein n=1 Tax=Nocardioides flavescens TaxID=2691959 RepID=A0A6L7EXE2_9ACTN|nr:adenylate/guanylate cyclase domain-containing protein [Nocardioides flavescens]
MADDPVERQLLGAEPALTRVEVAERAGVPPEVAQELWRLLGFAQQDDDAVAFVEADVVALRQAAELVELGILSPERQAALVRTWGRAFARLAEWQSTLLADVAADRGDLPELLPELVGEVVPKVEALQGYVWRRHLAGASARLFADGAPPDADALPLAVAFVDIVGFTSRSKELDERELVAWIEHFEAECSGIVVDHGGRVIKNIGDEVLFVVDEPTAAAEATLLMAARGDDGHDDFPQVRAGLAYGDVVARLGDVFGPTVNIASRLTSLARPGTVLVDRGVHDALAETDGLTFRRLHRTSVKGYAHLQSWALRRARD